MWNGMGVVRKWFMKFGFEYWRDYLRFGGVCGLIDG